MNELIKVTYSAGEPTVSARDLHEGLEIKTAFKDWFPRMIEYGFEAGKDFNMLKNKVCYGCYTCYETKCYKAAQQTVSCSGKKMTGNIVIKGDGNLVAGNIRKGKSVFGVSGNVNAYRSGFKQINSNGSGYITISPGFYITAWVLMKVGDANNVSITVPWNAKDTIVLPGCPAYTVSRSGNSITIKVYSANAQYNCYYTGYDN